MSPIAFRSQVVPAVMSLVKRVSCWTPQSVSLLKPRVCTHVPLSWVLAAPDLPLLWPRPVLPASSTPPISARTSHLCDCELSGCNYPANWFCPIYWGAGAEGGSLHNRRGYQHGDKVLFWHPGHWHLAALKYFP